MHRDKKKNKSVQQAKLFLRYVDDIVRTVKGDPEKVLRAANLLHPNLQFTIEKPNTNGKMAVLDLQTSIDKNRKINCGWYQKPTDTGTILSFGSCAPLQYKRSLVEGTVHRDFCSTSTWEEYDKAIKINLKTSIRKVGRRGLHRMPLKRSSGRAKTKRT